MKFEVGDIVEWCGVKGIVVEIDSLNAFCNVRCKFEYRIGKSFHWFSKDGRSERFHKEPSLKLIRKANEEPELYYRWRIWLKDTIYETDEYLHERKDGSLVYVDGRVYYDGKVFLKKEKISEGVAKIEGQE